MTLKKKEVHYKCPKCKSTEEIIGLQLTGLKKNPTIIRHICGQCSTHMVRHVIDVSVDNPKLKHLVDTAVMVRRPLADR